MALEDGLQRVKDIVREHPGEYPQSDLVRELRISYHRMGLFPSLTEVQGAVQQAISNGEIEIRSTPGMEHRKRCYLTSTSQPHQKP